MRELGEFGLIARMNAGRAQAPDVVLGPGDDAAVIAAPAGRYVVSADMLIQDRHFRLDWSSPREIGAKAIAQNAADVVAMGSAPSAFLVSLGCPADTTVEFIDGLVEGLWAEAGRAGGSIAGGDVVSAPLLVISVTAFGDPAGRPPVLRSGARPGDIVAVAGRLGWSAAGLAILSAGLDGEPCPELVAAHRLPCPPYEAVLELPRGTAVTAMTDVSDGLLADIGHIAESSGVAIDLDTGAVRDETLDRAAKLVDADPLAWALTGGEDHAFAATFAAGQQLPGGWRRVGRVEAGTGVTVDGRGWSGPVGWESFTGGG